MDNQYSKPTVEVMEIGAEDWSLHMQGANVGGCNEFDDGDRYICS